MNQLLLSDQNLKALRIQMEEAESPLFKDQAPIDNELLTEASQQYQKKLRKVLYSLEKELLEIRYNCDEFLAETITAQNKKSSK